MALVHYLYIGHFIPDQGYVLFRNHKPVVTGPVNRLTAVRLLKNSLGDAANLDQLSDDWAMSILPEYIVCDQLGSPPAALRFAADYAQQEGATIVDMGSFCLLSPEQLRLSISTMREAQPA